MRTLACNRVARGLAVLAAALLLVAAGAQPAQAQFFQPIIPPEQRRISVRDPSELPKARIPQTPPPPTVFEPGSNAPPREITLDDTIRMALGNSDVVRVLAGVTAVASGRTIYDPAIANTAIDEEQARFDPTVQVRNSFNRRETPQAAFDPADPSRAQIGGVRTDDYDLDFGLSKTTRPGGQVDFGVNNNLARFRPGFVPLNPQDNSSVDLSYTQPLLEGAGFAVNRAPIVLARIDTERSYFQFKDSMQELVRGTVEAYWALVFARTDLWARERQVEQADFAYARTQALFNVGNASSGDVAQTRVALANFRASLIGAQANVLQREAALRNLLRLPPYDPNRVVPVTPPTQERLDVDWEGVVELAEQRRPDLIELKLVIEADRQLLLQARNRALPQVDTVALYRWNGLEGEMPIGEALASGPGQFTDWTLGVNFSVPLGLRQSRAQLRRRELIIARDRANLQQGLHSAVHALALSVRNLAQFHAQYQAFKETHAAARENLEQQMRRYSTGLTEYINVLQAIVDWGNAISNEAQSLAQYNTELANLELETGTILETHGVRFYEERFASIGPLGRLQHDRLYPSALPAEPNGNRYPSTDTPAEEFFDLEDPLKGLELRRLPELEEIPPPEGR